MDSQLKEYIPILILGLVAIGFAVGTLVLSVAVGKYVRRREQAATLQALHR